MSETEIKQREARVIAELLKSNERTVVLEMIRCHGNMLRDAVQHCNDYGAIANEIASEYAGACLGFANPTVEEYPREVL